MRLLARDSCSRLFPLPFPFPLPFVAYRCALDTVCCWARRSVVSRMRLLSRVGVAERWGSGELGIDWVCVGLALLQPPIVVLAGSGRAVGRDRESVY